MNAPAAAPGSSSEQRSQQDSLTTVLRPLIGFVANVTVLTALLVYFGWERSETQAKRLGIDQSVLGMSTRDYVLRSVGPVFWLLLVVGVVGLVALLIEPRVTRFVHDRSNGAGYTRPATTVVALLMTAFATLPALVVLIGYPWPRLAFILWPASFGAGVVLLLYALHLLHRRPQDRTRSADNADDRAEASGEQRRRTLVRAFGGLLVILSLFWMASRYAQVLGVRLADELVSEMYSRPEVVVTSQDRLHLEGPGVIETTLDAGDAADAGGDGSVRYRYGGLRLLEHTGGKLFLVPEGWTRTYGVVFVIAEDNPGVRFDFVRDRRVSN